MRLFPERPKWRHKVGFWQTLLCLVVHTQTWETDGMHRWRVDCECGRSWSRSE